MAHAAAGAIALAGACSYAQGDKPATENVLCRAESFTILRDKTAGGVAFCDVNRASVVDNRPTFNLITRSSSLRFTDHAAAAPLNAVDGVNFFFLTAASVAAADKLWWMPSSSKWKKRLKVVVSSCCLFLSSCICRTRTHSQQVRAVFGDCFRYMRFLIAAEYFQRRASPLDSLIEAKIVFPAAAGGGISAAVVAGAAARIIRNQSLFHSSGSDSKCARTRFHFFLVYITLFFFLWFVSLSLHFNPALGSFLVTGVHFSPFSSGPCIWSFIQLQYTSRILLQQPVNYHCRGFCQKTAPSYSFLAIKWSGYSSRPVLYFQHSKNAHSFPLFLHSMSQQQHIVRYKSFKLILGSYSRFQIASDSPAATLACGPASADAAGLLRGVYAAVVETETTTGLTTLKCGLLSLEHPTSSVAAKTHLPRRTTSVRRSLLSCSSATLMKSTSIPEKLQQPSQQQVLSNIEDAENLTRFRELQTVAALHSSIAQSVPPRRDEGRRQEHFTASRIGHCDKEPDSTSRVTRPYRVVTLFQPYMPLQRVRENVKSYVGQLQQWQCMRMKVVYRGQRRLAYLIKKQESAHIVEMTFDIIPSAIHYLNIKLKLDPNVLRFMILKNPPLPKSIVKRKNLIPPDEFKELVKYSGLPTADMSGAFF